MIRKGGLIISKERKGGARKKPVGSERVYIAKGVRGRPATLERQELAL